MQLDCNNLEALNTSPFATNDVKTINVCSFDASFALTPGVTGNYFEGLGAPSPWTGSEVEVQVVSHTQPITKRKFVGSVRVNGCRLDFKDKSVQPPVVLANSTMHSAWKDSGSVKSLLFTSYDGSQTVKIVDKENSHRDDTWPFFCQVILFARFNFLAVFTALFSKSKPLSCVITIFVTGLRHCF
jgi:hypothetical protein